MKRLTIENWAAPDATSAIFAVMEENGSSRQATGDDLARQLLHRRLAETVPQELHELFDAAVGIGLYGWFYYPLFALSANQLRRVADRAVQLRVRELDGPWTKRFDVRLDWLREQGVLREDEHYVWTQTRFLRNDGSHPRDFQPVQAPTELAGTIGMLAERIETLWDRAPAAPPRAV